MIRSIPWRIVAFSALVLSAVCAQAQTDTAALTLGVHWVVRCEANTGTDPMRVGETNAQYCLDRSAIIDQTDVALAAFDMSATRNDTIELTLHNSAALRFLEVTRRKIGLEVGVVLNGQLVSVVTIAGPTEHMWIAGLSRGKAESVIQAFQRGAASKTPSTPLPAGRAGSNSGVYRIGGGVPGPSLIRKQEPEYTARARKAEIQGTVALAVVIGPDGIAGDIHVLRSLAPDLDANAIECVREWRFRPAQKDGVPVPAKAIIEVNFRL